MKKNICGEFFKLETANYSLDWTKNKILLNSGRNALRYIVKAYNIKEINVPYYTCQFVWDILQQENCKINFYHIDENFMPIKTFDKNSYIIYNNYFGICSKHIKTLNETYKNLIIDNCQAFFSQTKGLASFYSFRKFFGVPDGGMAWCDKRLNVESQESKSYHLCTHLLKSYDKGYDESYINFLKNELEIDKMPLQKISKLTKTLLSNINYDCHKRARLNNFAFLHNHLKNKNLLNINLENDDVPMFYPFLSDNNNLYNIFRQNNILLAKCWPQIDKFLSNTELKFKNNLLLLPIDSRYNKDDMQEMINLLC